MVNYNAIVHEAEEGGYWAEVPALPGCFTEGATLDEIRANLREAIDLYRNPITGQTIIIPLHGNHDMRAGLQKTLMCALDITDADL